MSTPFSVMFESDLHGVRGALPFAEVRLLSSTMILVGDTYPPIRFEALDEKGDRMSLTGVTAQMEFTDVYGNSDVRDAVMEPNSVVGIFEIPWWPGATDKDITWHTMLRFKVPDGIVSVAWTNITIYSMKGLWATPPEVTDIAGGSHPYESVLRAIVAAQSVVRAWCSRPVASPVPDRVRQAVAILAARALAATESGGSSGGGIKSERIGDYSVSYSSSPLIGAQLTIDEDIKELLRPCRPSVYSTDIGPEDDALDPADNTPLPFSVSPT